MPTTYNGIGTHYYGESNRSARTAPCHSCGRFGPLESYNTRLWFVVLLIPVIPLGRKRIIDACPSCRRHRVARADEYEQARQRETAAGWERFRRERSAAAALDAHARLVAFHDFDQATELRSRALEMFPDDAPLRVGLGQHLSEAASYDEMAGLFEEAYEIDPDLASARSALATVRIAHGQLDEATDLLDFLREPGAGRGADLRPLLDLAQAYARQNDHEAALNLFAVLLREAPDLAQQPDVRALIRQAERYAGRSEESILPARRHSLRGLFVADGSPYSKGTRQLASFGVGLTLVVGALATSNEFIRTHRTIHVVNAGGDIQVQVDDAPPVAVAGGTMGRVVVSEGRHAIRLAGPNQPVQEIDVATGYFGRWTRSPLWAWNPGGEAVLQHVTITYAQFPPPPSEAILVGQPFLALPHVDYPFTAAPDSLRVNGRNQTIVKESVQWAREQDGPSVGRLAATNPDAALDFAEKRLRRHPDDQALFDAYLAAGRHARPRVVAFLRLGLDRRPISIPWHRAAQSLAPLGEQDRLIGEYDARLAREPGSAPLLYLRGRIEPDVARRIDYFERAAAADPRLPWPVLGLGLRALNRGRWDDAIRQLRRAEELHIDDDLAEPGIHEARLALGQATELVDEYRNKRQNNPMDLRTILFLFDALAASGRSDEIDSERAGFTNRLAGPMQGQITPTLRSCALYAADDRAGMEQFSREQLPQVPMEFRVHLHLALGRSREAGAVPGADRTDNPWIALAIALGLTVDGALDEAKPWRDRAIAALDAQGQDQHLAAEILRAAGPPTADQLDRIYLPNAERALFLATLARQFPDHADLRAEAARWNLRRSQPYLLVRRALAEPPLAAPDPASRP